MPQIDVAPGAQEKFEVQSLNISKINDINAIKVKNDAVFIEVVNKLKSGLLLADTNGYSSISSLKIIKVGSAVKDYQVGDVVLDFINQKGLDYMHKEVEGGTTRRFLMTNEYNINLAVGEDNLID